MIVKSNEIKLKAFVALIVSGFFLTFYCLSIYFSDTSTCLSGSIIDIISVELIAFSVIFVYASIVNALAHFLNEQNIMYNNWRRWFIKFWLTIFATIIITFLTFDIIPPFPGVSKVDTPIQFFIMIFFPNYLLVTIVSVIIEVWNAFKENKDLELSLANAEKEKATSQLVALQQKINPHFLFNSLSVLSELIHEDPQKADNFVQEFTKVYRYVLDFNAETVVTVKMELEFLNAYLFLQKIRFGESLKIENHLESYVLNQYVPPLSLQLLFENAIKHNQVCKLEPLSIQLKNNNGYLIVTNNLQPRLNVVNSKGLGLSNLKKTYHLISENQPEFYQTAIEFIAKIPLVTKMGVQTLTH